MIKAFLNRFKVTSLVILITSVFVILYLFPFLGQQRLLGESFPYSEIMYFLCCFNIPASLFALVVKMSKKPATPEWKNITTVLFIIFIGVTSGMSGFALGWQQ